jgi:hypothetical protein
LQRCSFFKEQSTHKKKEHRCKSQRIPNRFLPGIHNQNFALVDRHLGLDFSLSPCQARNALSQRNRGDRKWARLLQSSRERFRFFHIEPTRLAMSQVSAKLLRVATSQFVVEVELYLHGVIGAMSHD